MKTTLIVLILVALTGCAHYRLDSASGTNFTVCCRHCNADNWKKATEEVCKGGTQLLGMATNSYVTGESYDYNGTTINRKSEQCRKFECFGMLNY